MKLNLQNEAETIKLGKTLAPLLEKGDTIALEGPLASGKTTLARAILRELGETGQIPSPTFTLVQNYNLPKFQLSHIDLYRIQNLSEIAELGLEDAETLLIEWPERMGETIPETRLHLRLEITPKNDSRIIHINPLGKSWENKIQKLAKNIAA